MPLAVEGFDLSKYDLILSSSYAVAKGLLSSPEQLHLCYCHSPIRYAWDLQEQYLRQTGMDKGIKGGMARLLLHYIRLWDSRTPNGVDAFAANSEFIRRRIWKVYRREAKVIYPPVSPDILPLHGASNSRCGAYVSLGRLVPYKRVDLLIEAFRKLPGKTLHVIGDGPERGRLERDLPNNVRLLGRVSQPELLAALQNARALVFAAEEDFGIALVEAQAAGTPVIAYGRGGALETVVHGVTGILFSEQNAEAVVAAVEEAEAAVFDSEDLSENVQRFAPERFRLGLKSWIAGEWEAFVRNRQAVRLD
jgi:glycosyltransferase involved in cell wall biosynthesis